MHDRPPRATNGFERARHERRARLGEHLDGDVFRNVVAFDQGAHEVEIDLRRGRKSHLDFLEPDVAKHPEQAQLLFEAHRLEQSLIAVAQIGAHPLRRPDDAPCRPLPVGQFHRREGPVFVVRFRSHDRDPQKVSMTCILRRPSGHLLAKWLLFFKKSAIKLRKISSLRNNCS
jgi:hypothetical protein